jgi:predicted TIM-barrel fold metal-dependent hydrolase
MINGKFVIDAVTHAFDARPELAAGSPGYVYGMAIHDGTFAFQHGFIPDPYRLHREEYFQRMTADALESALFLESPTDLAWFHSIPAWGIWPDLSPASVGLEICERRPSRMFMYGAVSPLEGTKAIEDLERQVDEWAITGVKLYPADFIDGQLRSWYMNDESVIYPILQRCSELGVRVVAIHKAVPLGNAPTQTFRPDDVDYAARDFPGLNFEIVHGGFAFLEETAFQVARFENIYVNLEASSGLLLHSPGRFARILGELMLWGGARKIVWGTGTTAIHPAPLVEAFDAFEFSEQMTSELGYPQLDDEIKRDILARNFVRMHRLDLDELAERIRDDEVARTLANGPVPAWSGLRDAGANGVEA